MALYGESKGRIRNKRQILTSLIRDGVRINGSGHCEEDEEKLQRNSHSHSREIGVERTGRACGVLDLILVLIYNREFSHIFAKHFAALDGTPSRSRGS